MDKVDDFKKVLNGIGRSENTIKAYCHDISKFYSTYDEVNTENVNEFIRSKVLAKAAPSSIFRAVSALKLYCNLYEININFKRIPMPSLKHRESSFITDEVFAEGISRIDAYDKKINKEFIKGVFTVLFNTGLRVDELLSLKQTNITGKGFLQVIGKGDKQRSIPVHNSILFYLENPEFYSFLSTTKRHKIWVWTKLFFGKEFSPHSFRHGFTTKLVNKKVNENAVKKVLGHTSYTTTLKYFHSDLEEVKEEVINALNDGGK